MDQLYLVNRYQEEEDQVKGESDNKIKLDILLSCAKSRKLEYEKVKNTAIDEEEKLSSKQISTAVNYSPNRGKTKIMPPTYGNEHTQENEVKHSVYHGKKVKPSFVSDKSSHLTDNIKKKSPENKNVKRHELTEQETSYHEARCYKDRGEEKQECEIQDSVNRVKKRKFTYMSNEGSDQTYLTDSLGDISDKSPRNKRKKKSQLTEQEMSYYEPHQSTQSKIHYKDENGQKEELEIDSVNHVKKRKCTYFSGENSDQTCLTDSRWDISDKPPRNKSKKKSKLTEQEMSYHEPHRSKIDCTNKNISVSSAESNNQVFLNSENLQTKHKERKKHKEGETAEAANIGEVDSAGSFIMDHANSEHLHNMNLNGSLDDSRAGCQKSHDFPESLKENKDELSSLDDEANSASDREVHEKDFLVIGEVQGQKKDKVKRILPDWLANPTVIDDDLRRKEDVTTDCPQLDPGLILSLRNSGITNLFPVQKAVVPWLLNNCVKVFCFRPRDLCVSAPTGSGKTLAFVLPIVHSLKERVVCSVRALVVLPVRGLAVQVFRVFKEYCKRTSLKVALVVGQKTFTQEQMSLVKKGIRGFHSLADIIVATPGRLVDHINRTEGFSLKHLRFLIIDEADRMMEEIQHGWLVEVEKSVYGDNYKRNGCCCYRTTMHQKSPVSLFTTCSYSYVCEPLQKLLYSATLSQDPEKLEQLSLFHPALFTSVVKRNKNEMDSKENLETASQEEVQGNFIGKYSIPAELQEYYTVCETSIKPLFVWCLIKNQGFKRVLCFTHSVESTHRLRLVIEQLGDFKVREFSSSFQGISQKIILKQFAAGKINILVCSDAMARGMDVKNVDCVISYDPPHFIKTYIHRIGRTARAGKHGVAITVLQKKHVRKFQEMVKSTGKDALKEINIPNSQIELFQDRYKAALATAAKIVEGERRNIRLKKNPCQKAKIKGKKK